MRSLKLTQHLPLFSTRGLNEWLTLISCVERSEVEETAERRAYSTM